MNDWRKQENIQQTAKNALKTEMFPGKMRAQKSR